MFTRLDLYLYEFYPRRVPAGQIYLTGLIPYQMFWGQKDVFDVLHIVYFKMHYFVFTACCGI